MRNKIFSIAIMIAMANLKGWAGVPKEEREGNNPIGPNHFHVLQEQLQLKEQEEAKKKEEENRKAEEEREKKKEEIRKRQEYLYYQQLGKAQMHQL